MQELIVSSATLFVRDAPVSNDYNEPFFMTPILMRAFAQSRTLLPAAMLVLAFPAYAQDPGTGDVIPELVVTSQRREQPRLDYAGNIDTLTGADIGRVGHQHISELLNRVAGVWIARLSGQEYLTAIRSPVLNGAGSCGGILYLEDGIPIRPAGFCNVNQFFEVVTEQAQSIEVIRGPGDAVYGSNALHGIVNTIMPQPGDHTNPVAALELGANEYIRVRSDFPFTSDSSWIGSAVIADDGGFRDQTGYRQAKLHFKQAWSLPNSDIVLGLSATDLDQQTAGSISGENSYKDPALNRTNPNPEAFRRANSQRIYARWTGDFRSVEFDVRPYVRRSNMEFLQHFFPGQPFEENGQKSAGLISTLTKETSNYRIVAGADLEWSEMYVKERQSEPAEGSAFVVETRPIGKHYDYDVNAVNAALFAQSEYLIGERWALGIGARLELMNYDYRNRMLDGNTRDDGTECGFGGCLFSRPADRNDRFTDFAPKLSIRYSISDSARAYARLTRGFRAPQATELYRLQSGQAVADLDSERVDSFEFGVVGNGRRISTDVAIFAMRKSDSVFRNSDGYNVSGARTTHRGIEAAVDWRLASNWVLQLDVTYARHKYDKDVVASGGQNIASGLDVDTAPHLLSSVELIYDGDGRLDGSIQFSTLGTYFLDVTNLFEYPGHTVANATIGYEINDKLSLIARLNNIADRLIADRADYSFGNYRYWPGRGRELFAEFRYSP